LSRINEFGIYHYGMKMADLFIKTLVNTNSENKIHHHYFAEDRRIKESKSGFEMIEGPLKFLSFGFLVSSLILAIEFIHFKILLIFSRFYQ
jgi:hypothetical protein